MSRGKDKSLVSLGHQRPLCVGKWRDFGPGLGARCYDCGIVKPRLDQEVLPSCPGKVLANRAELQARQGTSLASLLLGWAMARRRLEEGVDVDPARVKANEASARSAFADLPFNTYARAFQEANVHAKDVFRSVDASTDPGVHMMAACLMLLRLTETGNLHPADGAALFATDVLMEAQEEGSLWPNYREGELGSLADRMLKRAGELGYYGGRLGVALASTPGQPVAT